MATTNFETGLFKHITAEIAGTPEPLLNQVIREVVQDFCRETQCWTESLKPIDIKADVSRYSVQPSGTDREIHKVISVVQGKLDEKVHDGTDELYWTATAGQGTWDFASTTRSYSGGLSIDTSSCIDTDYATFARGRDFTTSSHKYLYGVIFNTSWTASTDDIAVQFYLDGSTAGSSLNISDYIDEEVLNEWQTFKIPLSTFGSIASVDSIRLTIANAPNSFLDSVRILLDNTPSISRLRPSTDFTMDGYQTISLNSRPSEDKPNQLWAGVCNVPSATGTAINSETYDRYQTVLASGVKWKLFAMANSSWGDLNQSMYHEAYYKNGKNRCRDDIRNLKTNYRSQVKIGGTR